MIVQSRLDIVRRERWRRVTRLVLAGCYAAVGTLHLRAPAGFVAIVPRLVPFPHRVVALTGWCELAGAAGLLLLPVRRFAGAMLALYAVCVFPANINHAVNGIAIGGRVLGWWYHAPRLLLQPLLVWWALFAGGCVDWPFGSRGPRPDPSAAGRPP